MPLPDERPRQSVANLIGRFEQQTKRQSLSPAAVTPRSLSVSSHITGDSAKEEVKEKREWPPKLVGNSSVSTPPSSWTRSTPSVSDPQSISEVTPGPQAVIPDASPSSDLLEKSTTPSSPTHPPLVGEAHVTASTPLPPTSSPPVSPVKSPASKATNRPLVKPTAKPAMTRAPPRQSLTPSASQPLKPQHTGQSASGARKPVPRTAPSTPSRAKTPSRPSTTITRPKTPTTATPRPKTPSGLFAPTAASLARARNAQPQLPTPVKKVALSSSSADRLSKPTAASLNRARTPTAISPPSRGTPKATPRGGATRGAPRASMSAGLVKDIPLSNSATGATAAASVVGIAATLEAEDIPDEEEVPHADGRHQLYLSGSTEVGSHDDDIDSTPAVHGTSGEVHTGVAITQVATDVEAVTNVPPEVKLEPATVETSAEEHHDLGHESDVSITASDTGETLHSDPDYRVDEVKPRLHIAGDDLEDIVNLLESVPSSKSRPESIAAIPDEVHEIPDEE